MWEAITSLSDFHVDLPVVYLSQRLYAFLKSVGTRSALIRMYLYRDIGVCRYMFSMSAHASLAPGVLMVEFHRIFAVVRSAVLVVSSPG